MFTVLVAVRVRPDRVQQFRAAIAVNAAASVHDEPGCLVFDVQQSKSDPLDYLFYEIYRDEESFYVAHRAAAHYADWQVAAAGCLEPGIRTNTYWTPVSLDGDREVSARRGGQREDEQA
jgi:autoinducer 2-degrading protein